MRKSFANIIVTIYTLGAIGAIILLMGGLDSIGITVTNNPSAFWLTTGMLFTFSWIVMIMLKFRAK